MRVWTYNDLAAVDLPSSTKFVEYEEHEAERLRQVKTSNESIGSAMSLVASMADIIAKQAEAITELITKLETMKAAKE